MEGAPGGARALVGTVTLEGEATAAYADGERRALAVFGPGGLRWRPRAGQEVLVLKTGEDGELGCVAGVRVDGAGLAPGEVALEAASGGAGVRLLENGTVAVTGRLTVNGEPLEDLIFRLAGGVG